MTTNDVVVVSEDCCSAVSGTPYSDIDCAAIAVDGGTVGDLETEWKGHECGRSDRLPTEWMGNGSECRVLWASLSQIHGMCADYDFTRTDMKLYDHFADRGAAECFGRDAAESRVTANVSAIGRVEWMQSVFFFNDFEYFRKSNHSEHVTFWWI